jgi:hypothetical protein
MENLPATETKADTRDAMPAVEKPSAAGVVTPEIVEGFAKLMEKLLQAAPK